MYLDDVFIRSQAKRERFKVLDRFTKIFFYEKRKTAPDKSPFFLILVKFLGHIIEKNTIAPLKLRYDATLKLQPAFDKEKKQQFIGMLSFLSNFVEKM